VDLDCEHLELTARVNKAYHNRDQKNLS